MPSPGVADARHSGHETVQRFRIGQPSGRSLNLDGAPGVARRRTARTGLRADFGQGSVRQAPDNGVIFHAPITAAAGLNPVVRMYHPMSGDTQGAHITSADAGHCPTMGDAGSSRDAP